MLPRSRYLPLCLSFIASMFAGCMRSEPVVVVYSALDRPFSEPVLERFTDRTGIRVLPKFDTEANKSVGLYHDLIREAGSPRCDVHWNNEILATIRLQRRGILMPYHSPNGFGLPHAEDFSWHGFAARARVLIVNTEIVADGDVPKRLADLAQPRFRGKVAMAKPFFGTTATHAACLFAYWKARDGTTAKAERFFRSLKENAVRIVPGNKQVAVGVGRGQFAVGITDTDDAIAEVRAGRPVQIVFPDQGAAEMGTLFLPNTVALIRGCPHPEAGKRLIDFLLSPEVEKSLAESSSCQIPLRKRVQAALPVALQPALTARRMEIDFASAADCWDESQRFLVELFGR